jgi:glucose-6-phosphate-specific signal transduction histidine kinase
MQTIKDFIAYLQGKKTEIFSAALPLIVLLKEFGIWNLTDSQEKAILSLLAALLGISLGSRIKRSNKEILGKLENNK